MVRFFQRIWHYLSFLVRLDLDNSRANILAVGLIGSLGHPIYWLIWTYLFPQGYENLYLRLFCAGICVPMIFYKKIPRSLDHIKPFYWYFAVTMTLPFIFSFLLLMNNFSRVYMICGVMLIFLLLIFFHSIVTVLTSLIFGTLLGYLLFLVLAPNGFSVTNYYVLWETLPLIGFAIVAGGIFSHSLRTGVALTQALESSKERAAQLRSLAGSIAHEMRNPLAQLKYSLDGIGHAMPSPSSGRNNLSEEQLNNIFKALAQGQISVSRGMQVIAMTLGEVNDKPVDPANFAYLIASKATSKAIEEYSYETPAERQKIQMRVERDFIFKGDETLYLFVLFNLIKNALYYFKADPNAKITLTVDDHTVSVKDTGPGIPPNVLPDLFRSFQTSGKTGGTGLGLAFCKRTMQAFGGDITCQSEFGEYTEFLLHFTAVPRAQMLADEKIHVERAAPLFRDQRILIVDDQESLRLGARMMLQGLGCQIDEAENGQVAIEMLKKQDYLAILLDLNMPVLDGYLTSEKIRAGAVPHQKDIPILAHTSESAYMATVKTEKVGMNGFVHKPCTRIELIDAFSIAVRKVQSSRQVQALAQAAQLPLSEATVVVADDSEPNREIVRAYLTPHVRQVLEAEHGQAVLDILAQGTVVHAILLDMHMPVMGGLEAAEAIRAQPMYKNLPIFALTGDFTDDVVAATKEAGMNDFLSKPLHPGKLLQKLGEYLGRAPVVQPTAEQAPAAAPAAVATPAVAAAKAPSDESMLGRVLNEVPLLDVERIESYIGMGMLDTLDKYLNEMPQLYEQLVQHNGLQDLKALKFSLHSLLGISGNAGAQALHYYIRNGVYRQIHDGVWPDDSSWIDDIALLIDKTTQRMRQEYFL